MPQEHTTPNGPSLAECPENYTKQAFFVDIECDAPTCNVCPAQRKVAAMSLVNPKSVERPAAQGDDIELTCPQCDGSRKHVEAGETETEHEPEPRSMPERIALSTPDDGSAPSLTTELWSIAEENEQPEDEHESQDVYDEEDPGMEPLSRTPSHFSDPPSSASEDECEISSDEETEYQASELGWIHAGMLPANAVAALRAYYRALGHEEEGEEDDEEW
ncbi:hypothetical protein BDW74DRAFT_176609 [Aspergillus multicolor]|uniref:uncharacterized protein n=1 Tax=Aspergillus multicolor TaxID=41759 RepID=UPI003CCD9771